MGTNLCSHDDESPLVSVPRFKTFIEQVAALLLWALYRFDQTVSLFRSCIVRGLDIHGQGVQSLHLYHATTYYMVLLG